MKYYNFILILITFYACDSRNTDSEPVLYYCDEGFSIELKDSSGMKIAKIIHDQKEIASINFSNENGTYRSNELSIDKLDEQLSITLSGTEVYTNCLKKALRKKNFLVKDEKQGISSFIINDLLGNKLDSLTPDQRQYVYERIDLNGDGTDEYFVIPMTQKFCNDDGCLVYILNTSFKQHSMMRIGGPPICIEHGSNGTYRNILFQTDGKMRRAIPNKEGDYPLNTMELEVIETSGYSCDPLFDGGFPEKRISY